MRNIYSAVKPWKPTIYRNIQTNQCYENIEDIKYICTVLYRQKKSNFLYIYREVLVDIS